jgi:hypothetical protein
VDIHGEKVERTEVSLGNPSAKGRRVILRPLLFLSLPLFTNVMEQEFCELRQYRILLRSSVVQEATTISPS